MDPYTKACGAYGVDTLAVAKEIVALINLKPKRSLI
jgi:hypothetical protein